MQTALDWLRDNDQRLVDDLGKLVAIPSISTDGEHAKEIDASAALTCDLMRRAGLCAVPEEFEPTVEVAEVMSPALPRLAGPGAVLAPTMTLGHAVPSRPES